MFTFSSVFKKLQFIIFASWFRLVKYDEESIDSLWECDHEEIATLRHLISEICLSLEIYLKRVSLQRWEEAQNNNTQLQRLKFLSYQLLNIFCVLGSSLFQFWL